ncbi:MAG TPA: hypothetical protein VGM88_11725 [Kofleriaceae bacterium]|jgi:hypothetical protein
MNSISGEEPTGDLESNPTVRALLDTIQFAVGDGADEAARAAGRDACKALAFALGEPIAPAIAPAAPTTPHPGSTAAVIAATLNKLPADQVLPMAIDYLRKRIGPEQLARVAPPRPIQFRFIRAIR